MSSSDGQGDYLSPRFGDEDTATSKSLVAHWSAVPKERWDGSMRMLLPEEMQELRNEIAAIAISDTRKDELIRFIDAIAASFIQQAFYKSSVQLSLSARANFAFIGGEAHASLHHSDVSEAVDLDDESATNTDGPARHLKP